MRIKSLAHKNQMGKKKATNVSTSWVPSRFSQSDLTKDQKDGFIAEGDQVIFPSTECIPKPPSGYQVMFLAFFLHGLSFPGPLAQVLPRHAFSVFSCRGTDSSIFSFLFQTEST
jgi:hypothetical protein